MNNYSIDPQTIAFAVITFYPKWYRGNVQSIRHTDKVRGDLALEFLTKATQKGYNVAVVDGNSSKSFKKELASFSNIKVVRRKGYKRSPSKRQAYKLAAAMEGVSVIIAAEAEKVSLINAAQEIAKPLVTNKADIVVPKREQALFKETYPAYMYESEVEGNTLYNEQLKLYGFLTDRSEELDMFFGPRAFRNDKKLVKLFCSKFLFHIGNHTLPDQYFDPEELSNASFFPIVQALRKGLRVETVTVPFVYPKLQKENESIGAVEFFIEKRRAQRLGLLVELMHFLTNLDRKKKQ